MLAMIKNYPRFWNIITDAYIKSMVEFLNMSQYMFTKWLLIYDDWSYYFVFYFCILMDKKLKHMAMRTIYTAFNVSSASEKLWKRAGGKLSHCCIIFTSCITSLYFLFFLQLFHYCLSIQSVTANDVLSKFLRCCWSKTLFIRENLLGLLHSNDIIGPFWGIHYWRNVFLDFCSYLFIFYYSIYIPVYLKNITCRVQS